MGNQLLQAAKRALEFIESIEGYANGKTANELRSAIEAAQQERVPDAGDSLAESELSNDEMDDAFETV